MVGFYKDGNEVVSYIKYTEFVLFLHGTTQI